MNTELKNKDLIRNPEILSKIAEKLKGNVHAVYVFGSILTEKFNMYSDIDIIIIHDTQLKFYKRSLEFEYLFDIYSPLDLLIYTPLEFKYKVENPTLGFWSEVVRTMVKIV